MFTLLQSIISILLVVCIVIQHRVSGLSAAFGGDGTTYVQRRGAEKALYKLTVWLSVAFFALPILQWFFV